MPAETRPSRARCASLWPLLLAACGPTSNAIEIEGHADSEPPPSPIGGSTGPAPGSTGDDVDPGPASGESDDGGPPSNFLNNTDVGELFECSTFRQDCPAGHKCNAWSSDGGGAWNSTRCFPVDQDPDHVGETCTVIDSGVSGMDSCDVASMCWDVNPETNEGTCVPMCVGSANGPLCEDPARVCVQAAGGVLNLCLPKCHPAEPACPEGEGCYPDHSGFRCRPDATGGAGQVGDPCEFTSACVAGTGCMPDGPHTNCPDGASACCRPFCRVGDLGPPCSVIEHCAPWEWFAEDQPPPGLEDVGYCAFPDL